MAIRPSASAYLQRYTAGSTVGIPQNTGNGGTVLVWGVRRTQQAQAACWLLLRGEGTSGQYQGIYTNATDSSIGTGGTWDNTPTMSTIATGEVVMVGLGVASTSAVAWTAPASAATPVLRIFTIGATPQFNMIRLGCDGYGAFLNGDLLCAMAWDRLLTQPEVTTQRYSRTPINRAGLLWWLPMMDPASLAPNLDDFSGAGLGMPAQGTPTAVPGEAFAWELTP